VDRELCKEASISLRPELVGQVEIISPEEYKARLAAFDKQEEETTIVYGNGQSVLDREHFNVYHKHVLYQTIYDTISFLRDKPSDRMPSRVLASAEFFEGRDIKIVEDKVISKTTGKFDPPTVMNFLLFVSGYRQGTQSSIFDGGARGDQLIKVLDSGKKL